MTASRRGARAAAASARPTRRPRLHVGVDAAGARRRIGRVASRPSLLDMATLRLPGAVGAWPSGLAVAVLQLALIALPELASAVALDAPEGAT